MSEMVERAAAAIDAILGSDHESLSIEMGCGDLAKKMRAEAMGEAARAAIEAMREPTQAMRYAGGDAIQGPAGTGSAFDVAADGWRAMIDAALSRPNSKTEG